MTRATHGIERLDYNTYTVLIGGLGDVPEDVGINLKTWYFAPRLGAMYRLEREVGGARRLRPDDQPAAVVAADARLVPVRHQLQPHRRPVPGAGHAGAAAFPTVPIPDISSGRVPLPQGVFMRSPNPDDVEPRHHPAVERRLRVPAAVGHLDGGRLRRHRAPTAAMPT